MKPTTAGADVVLYGTVLSYIQVLLSYSIGIIQVQWGSSTVYPDPTLWRKPSTEYGRARGR